MGRQYGVADIEAIDPFRQTKGRMRLARTSDCRRIHSVLSRHLTRSIPIPHAQKLPKWLVLTSDGDALTVFHGSTNDDAEVAQLLAAFPGSVTIQ